MDARGVGADAGRAAGVPCRVCGRDCSCRAGATASSATSTSRNDDTAGEVRGRLPKELAGPIGMRASSGDALRWNAMPRGMDAVRGGRVAMQQTLQGDALWVWTTV